MTIVAAFNAVLIGGGAFLLGIPLAGTIAVVTFLGAYIPYLGAWTAGAFSVVLALGGAGTDAAIAMAVLQLLGNGILQQMVQPFAYGAALDLHPLAVLIVTIGGGALFGAAGLILAAPLTSAVVRIAADLSAPRRRARAGGGRRSDSTPLGDPDHRGRGERRGHRDAARAPPRSGGELLRRRRPGSGIFGVIATGFRSFSG